MTSIANSQYYRQMKALAGEKRLKYGIETSKIDLNVIHKIYREEEIKLDYWDFESRTIKASYFADGEPSVLVNKNLPREPKLFALVHELKHHYVDRESILKGEHQCGAYNENEVIEIGAEVFAAQFIYPDEEMIELLEDLQIEKDHCTPETIVQFKQACGAVVSYQFLLKRFERFGYIAKGEYAKVKFKKLEEELLGTPFYKQSWYKAYRKRTRR